MQSAGRPRFRVSICGIAELPWHCAAGVTDLVSILDPDWPEPDALAGLRARRRLDLRFHDIIDPERGYIMPQLHHVESLIDFGSGIGSGAPPEAELHVLLHCHAGQSRSTASAILLVAQARPDLPPDALFELVREMRPHAWPNLLLLEFGDRLLGRDGAIVAAAGRFYRDAIARDPALADFMAEGGRGREVMAAYGR